MGHVSSVKRLVQLATYSFPDLTHFFTPRSFALVGATADITRFGGRALKITQEFGFCGKLYPVNPRGGTIRDLTVYPTVRELPEAPDHVGVVVAADRVLGVLEDCAARGAKFVTVLTSGFAETGTERGRALQAAITAFGRDSGVRVMGPNCNGFINFVDRMVFASTATIAGAPRPTGFVSVAAQSGGLGMVNAMWRALEAGLGVNHVVTCGNDADLDILDFANFMIEDGATRVVMLIAERIPSGEKLFALARKAAELAKPILIVKLGRTDEGRRAAQSHTGAMTGSDVVHDAAFRQAGIIRCVDCNEMYEAAMLLGSGKIARGRGASSLSISGGNVVMLTDLGSVHGIQWPQYSEATHASLSELMPSYGRVSNPTDLTTAAIGSADMYQRVLDTIAADNNVDVMMPIVTFGTRAEIDYTVHAALRADKPFALLWSGGCIDEPNLRPRDLVAGGIGVYRDVLECVRAVARTMDYGQFLARFRASNELGRPAGIDRRRAIESLRSCGARLTEHESKLILEAYGLKFATESVVTSADAAVAFAARIGGLVAMKISSPDIPHKTEAGGVRLNVRGADAIRAAYDEILAAARSCHPDALVDGVLVQEMLPKGVELVVGITRDPVFGPVIAVGIGGVHVEVLADMAYRVAPVSRHDARDMLDELRGAKLLRGVRGEGARDVDAVCEAIEQLSWLAVDLRDDIAEVDINPLVVFAQGAGYVAADALVVRTVSQL